VKTLARADDRAEILRRVRLLSPEARPLWGRMSAPQVICHLSDAFRMAMGAMTVRPATGFLERTVVKWIALHAPLRWPPRVRTVPEIDQQVAGTRPGEFAADLAQLEAALALFTGEPRTFDWAVHPIFGPLSEREWLRWGYLHMDHHLRQFHV
jgi:hypothetical protein